MVSRRRILLGTLAASGALVVGWGALPPRQRLTGSQPLPAAAGEQAFNGWVKIGRDDAVSIVLARSEMGQGVSTALAMVLADELDADWAQVRTEMAPVDAIYNNLATVVDGLPFHPDDQGSLKRLAGWLTAKTMREVGLMVTGGSSSIKDLWLPMRQAGAAARAMLVAAAAAQWGVPADEVLVQRGLVLHARSKRQLRFGELAERAAALPLPKAPVLKTPSQFTLIGRTPPRRDAAAKHDGTARFGLDVTPAGLLYASLVMNPQLGGGLGGFDARAALALPGVKTVVAVPALRGATAGYAAVADTPWHAMQAAAAVQPQWTDGPAATLDSAGIRRQLGEALTADAGFAYHTVGDAEQALQSASKTLQAEYHAPLLAHATLEPQNCTVLFQPAAPGSAPADQAIQATVWAPTQVPGLARYVAAQALGLESEQVAVQVTLLGGGFGRRLDVDFVAQAAAIARALPGVPVQTFWSRAQDSTHDFYRPPCVARYRAGLDAQGRVTAWQAASAGPSIVHQYLQRVFGLAGAGPDKTTCEGAFDQAYEWPAARISHHIVALPVPVGFWRSVGHSHQAFFKESFLDECAHAAGQDPLAYRLALLQRHPRHAAVLRRAAELGHWGAPPAAAADGAKTARGLALHQSFGAIVAQVAEVSLDPGDAQRIRVHRVTAVIDCGTVVHPGIVRQQMESAIVNGLGAALYGEITLLKGQVQQANFDQQPLLRGADCPQIHTEIIASTEPPEGVGEPGLPPLAPAVANALFALTGQRLRSLPLKLA
ncbi:xanthine dehydrogenase family protein molybdopterin-binding subunit [Aquabacterium sp. OR-4]|uniref:xanthine dehydrogenase family protein molybdopterin-binding subunit n=1 Tax=Aquabacterium sp. OR-4 TaxID=2978127 RepID=UPI0021B47403|nr:molybdopterin cofactor-binding domain-containing protein [Aquabacterium sp. OR-4]MDT7836867.1 molybdopterin cofactor-binding domain-containing protein [Aquabacterium sp. OR-4]